MIIASLKLKLIQVLITLLRFKVTIDAIYYFSKKGIHYGY